MGGTKFTFLFHGKKMHIKLQNVPGLIPRILVKKGKVRRKEEGKGEEEVVSWLLGVMDARADVDI